MKYTFLRILSLALALLLFLSLITGCEIDIAGSSAQQDGGALNFYIYEPDTATDWYSEQGAFELRDSSSILQYILQGFQTDQTDVSVTITQLSTVKEYTDRVEAELIAGGGPDILIYIPGLYKGSVNKLADDGFLEDLNPYMKSDIGTGALHPERYFSAVMDAFTADGKRFGLPVCMEMDLFLAPQKALETVGAQAGVMDGTSPMELLYRLTKANPSVTKDSLLAYNRGGSSELMYTGGKILWDAEQKTAAFNTPEYKAYIEMLIQLLQNYPEYSSKKSWQVKDQNGEIDSAVYSQRTNQSVIESVQKNTFMFYQGQVSRIEFELGNIVHNFGGSEAQLLTYGDKNGSAVTVNSCLAINKNSEAKRSAYKFLKYALTTGQKRAYKMPVLKSALYDYLDMVYITISDENYREQAGIDHIPSKMEWDDYIAKLQPFTDNIGSVYVNDVVINGYIGEALLGIYEKKMTADAALEELQEKTIEYLSQ